LEQRAADHGIEFEHLGLTLGTVLHNVDLTVTPTSELTQLIRDTLLERKVIFFRDQHLDEDQQTAFGRQFGGLDAFPFGTPGDNPFILKIVHGPGSPGTENGWHTDVTWMEQPSLGSIAQCVVTPPYGGDTLFADSHAAYLGLPSALRERINHLSGINDYRIFIQGRGQGAMPDALVAEVKERIPFGVTHPLVRTHPETGKPALYLHGGFLRHESLFDRRTGETLDPNESKQIVTALLAQHGRPEYICRFPWQAGSIAFWDNRAVQHYAASDYYPHKRVLRRVTISGDRPYNNLD
jgi:taurine dioxygenase